MLSRVLFLVAIAVFAVAHRIAAAAAPPAELPVVEVTADDTIIDKSCRIVIPAGTVIPDVNGDGVIQIRASNITIEFAEGAVLRGSPMGRQPDEYRGYGIRLNGHSNVTIRNARVSGFWCGLWASKADGLTLEGVDASDNRRAHLRSTPVAEDGADWLFPHNNDKNEWLTNYAAAMWIEDSQNIVVRDCRVNHGQNALCLSRVTGSKIYDNDFSFNSGWGIALWRCERNVISRNAIDFCVRGYSHGVYNRGQDSAGILMFEQNNKNIIAENSATHGGDCFFGFAGREALGEAGQHPVEWYKRRGNCDNLLIGNDFSYAPAHGIEMTFSFGNQLVNNRLVDNAICGIWGGYSQETLIAGNTFENNGEMGYGLERGGVNIEHGRGNRIVQNNFIRNKCGVHLWGGANANFQQKGWGKANGIESADNLIGGNTFTGDALAFHFRGPGDVTLAGNMLGDVGKQMTADAAHKVTEQGEGATGGLPASVPAKNLGTGSKLPVAPTPPYVIPEHAVYGKARPVGVRPELRGRQNIIMTEWGPWDHQSPLVQLVRSQGGLAEYALHKFGATPRVSLVGDGLAGKLDESKQPPTYSITASKPGIYPYVMRAEAGDYRQELGGTLIATTWNATFFKWTKDVDPREHLEGWRKLATGSSAVDVELSELVLKYGTRGPSDLGLSPRLSAAKLGSDYFGMIARTRLVLPKGKWQFKTTSDDGVRVTVDGKPVIENWTWHVPTRNAGSIELPAEKTVEIVVEHFEIDGFATLEMEITPDR